MKRTAFLYLPVLCMGMSGCGINANLFEGRSNPLEWPPVTVLGADHPVITQTEPPATPEPVPSEEPIPYTVWYETSGLTSGLYEPDEGCYLAAQILPEDEETNELGVFNRRAGKKHAVFAYDMRLGDDFPEAFLLSCIAAQATPMIFIYPAQDNAVFSVAMLTELAEAFGAYNIPLFVSFFPLEEGFLYDAATYALYYRYARVIFAEHAPQAAFVWAADARIPNVDAWYPGLEAVDWVGLIYLQTDTGNTNLTEALDGFYQKFQQDKPIMLARFGVSHFSTRDCVYRTHEAADEINLVYEAIRNRYPRLKLVCYRDVTDPDEDFSVTKDDELLPVYQASAGDRHFLSALEAESEPVSLLRSAWPGYYLGGQIYVDASTLTDELCISAFAESTTINGKAYVDARAFDKTDSYLVADHSRGVVNIFKKIK